MVKFKHLLISASLIEDHTRFRLSEPVSSYFSALTRAFNHLSFCLSAAGPLQGSSTSQLKVFYISDFNLNLNLEPSGPRSTPRTAKRLVTLLLVPFSLSYSLPWDRNLPSLYIFSGAHTPRCYFFSRHVTHTIHVTFPLSFVCLKTQKRPVFISTKLTRLIKGQISDTKRTK